MRTYVWTGNKGEKVLLHDENFRKWQKSGESKTPGGVKIGIFRFVAVLSFCISTSPLLADGVNSANFKCSCIIDTGLDGDDNSCSQYAETYNSLSGNSSGQKCNAVNGCKYNSLGQSVGCILGDAGQYTVGGSGYNCSSDSSLYSFAGSYESNQCFKKLDGDTSDSVTYNNLPKCKDASGADVNACLYYPNIDSNGCVVCPTDSGQIGLMNKCTDSTNASNYTNQLTDYHIEGTEDNAKCYSNTRKCELFNKKYKATANDYYARGSTEATTNTVCENGGCSMGRTVRGDATWDGNKWIVSGCYAERNANDIIVKYGNSNAEQNAYCSGVILSKQENSNNPVNDANVAIYYNYGNYYLCTECNAGYVVANNAYATDSNTHLACYTTGGSNYTSNSSVYVCKCDPVDRGYYLTSQVQICNYSDSQSYSSCKKTLNQLNDLINPSNKRPCGPGQTTDGGAASAADCHYTNQTRFCDAHGCFYLSDLGWNATNGYTWGGATSTSPGQ